MKQSTAKLPDDCSFCIALFEALTSNREAGGGKISTAALGALVGLGERATRTHLSDLVLHSRIMADRRTPVEGARVGAPAAVPVEQIRTPLDWVAGVVVRDRTCRRLLVLYATHADRSWCGQMSVKEAAAALSVSSDTVVVHRKHLSGKDGGEVLVRFKRDSARARRGDRYIGRHVDTYILQSGVLGIEHVDPIPVGRNAEESWAYAVLAAAAWWTPTDRDQTFGAVRLLRRILVTNRWPSVEVTRRIDVVPYNPPNDHLALLSALLRDCMAPYVLSAREFVTGEPEALVTCVGCWRGIRRGQGARDGDLCGDCRRQAAGVPASGHGGLLPLAAGHTGHRVLEDPPF